MVPQTNQSFDQEIGDDALMARAALRDAAAFRLLVERYQTQPYRIAWRMLNDQTEAEDVAQEALLRLWSNASKWQPGGSGVAAWLTRVATNMCLDRLRRRRFSSDDDIPEREDDEPLADVQMIVAERRASAAAAVAALPDRQRVAIILTYYEELPNQQAAETLEMNVKAFESLLLRARSALKTMLADLKGDDHG
jgi:RNA polymerase sigma factor (sigma-70 family)